LNSGERGLDEDDEDVEIKRRRRKAGEQRWICAVGVEFL
jgi:hypothetical protein